MRYADLSVSLNNITGGTLSQGRVPTARSWYPVRANTSGAVTVTAALTSLLTIDLNDVEDSQLVIFKARLRMTKGATAGRSLFEIRQSAGTGLIQFTVLGDSLAVSEGSSPISSVVNLVLSGVARLVTAGTVTIELRALSAGSNGSVASGDAELELHQAKGPWA